MNDPLSILVKSTGEINELKQAGKLCDRHVVKRVGIKMAGRIIQVSFETVEEAEKWARWNYKGREDWEAIVLPLY